MALIPDNGIISPTPTSQEEFWTLQDEYSTFFAEVNAIKARHKQEWDDHTARVDHWQDRFGHFNHAHTGQTFQIYRPGQTPGETADQWYQQARYPAPIR